MSTLRQLMKYLKRKKKNKLIKCPALNKCPFKKGICLKVYVTNPKKPNSAKRKVAKVRIFKPLKYIIAAIPGHGHNLNKHSSVIIRGHGFKDVPGVNYKIVKGKLDFSWEELLPRLRSRSKYGIKFKYVAELKKVLQDYFKKIN